jgi:TrmH family RNA methyltransferase
LISRQKIKFIRSLQQRKSRDQAGIFVVEGQKSVSDALDCCPDSIDEIYISSNSRFRDKFVRLPGNIRLIEIEEAELSRISSLVTPQGILAVLRKPVDILPETDSLNDLVILLDRISDPGNLGTIIRLADWLGIDHIFCSKDTVDCYNPKVVQASMGAVLRVDIHYVDLSVFIINVKESTRLQVYATTLEGENIHQTNLNQPAAIIFGNEANGISKEIMGLANNKLLIPNYSSKKTSSESLNVSVAAAIVLSEFRRQSISFHSK